jgi:hypothetical protein
MTDGIRELSYEDALQSSRYRWQARAEAPGIVAPGKVDPVLEPAEDAPAHPAPVFQTPKVELLSDDVYENAALAPDTVSLSTIAEPRVCTATSAKKLLSQPVFKIRSPKPSHRSPIPAGSPLVWPAAGKPERQVSMSLRVAASEPALIKVRAAEAGLSASAYLRQCASSGAAAGAGSAHPCRYRAKFHVGSYPRVKLLFRLVFLDWRELRDFWNACDGESLAAALTSSPYRPEVTAGWLRPRQPSD